jgi:methionyl-tRNA synthetase
MHRVGYPVRRVGNPRYPPDAAHGIFDQLAWKLDEAGKDTRFRLADAVWGGLPDGHVLGKPVPLFPRIEAPAPAAEK